MLIYFTPFSYPLIKQDQLTIVFSNIRSITFDAARTLVYPIQFKRDYIKLSEMLVENGYEVYPQEFEAARNYVFFWDFPKMRIDNWNNWIRQIFRRVGYNNVEFDVIENVKEELGKFSSTLKLYDDVEHTISELFDQGLLLSIVTTIPLFMMKNCLKPIVEKFKVIVTGQNAGCAKGNPKMYQFDLNSKEVSPHENVFVGDNEYLDIVIPKKLGQKTIKITRNGISDQPTEADYQITSLLKLLDLFLE